MITIDVIKNNHAYKSLNISNILDKLSPSDIPYYINIEEYTESYIIKLIYIFDKEEKTIIPIGNTRISIGKISGKVYQYDCNEISDSSDIVNPLKFKDKVKELETYKNDLRFKTNISSFLNLLNEVVSM